MKDTSGTPRHRRSLKPLAWAAMPVISLGVGVLASGNGFDILLIATAGLLLLTLERTVGDWMGELLGAGPAGILFALGVAGLAYYFLGNSSGSAQTDRLLAAAEDRGYRSSYYRPTAAPETSNDGVARASSGQSPSGNSGNAPAPGGAAAGVVAASQSAPQDTEKEKPLPEATTAAVESQPKSAGTSGASRIVLGAPAAVPDPIPSTITLILSPAAVGRRATLQAIVTAGGHPVTDGSVEFIVDGAGAGRRALDARGTAATTFLSYIAGTYEVRARFVGTRDYAASATSRTLPVLSGGR